MYWVWFLRCALHSGEEKLKTSPLIVLSSSLTAVMAFGQVMQKRRADASVLPGQMISSMVDVESTTFNVWAHSLMVPLPPVKKSMRVTISCSTV